MMSHPGAPGGARSAAVPPGGRAEVMATIRNHTDRGDGFCETCLELDPCGVRLYQETVLSEMNRRRR